LPVRSYFLKIKPCRPPALETRGEAGDEPAAAAATGKVVGKLRPTLSSENLHLITKSQLKVIDTGAVPRSSSFRTADGRDSAHNRRGEDVHVFGCSVLERIKRFESEFLCISARGSSRVQ
jgi:hypothetical protein